MAEKSPIEQRVAALDARIAHNAEELLSFTREADSIAAEVGVARYRGEALRDYVNRIGIAASSRGQK